MVSKNNLLKWYGQSSLSKLMDYLYPLSFSAVVYWLSLKYMHNSEIDNSEDGSRFDRNKYFFFVLVSFPFVCSLPGYFTIKQYIFEKQAKIIDNYALMKVSSSATGLSFLMA